MIWCYKTSFKIIRLRCCVFWGQYSTSACFFSFSSLSPFIQRWPGLVRNPPFKTSTFFFQFLISPTLCRQGFFSSLFGQYLTPTLDYKTQWRLHPNSPKRFEQKMQPATAILLVFMEVPLVFSSHTLSAFFVTVHPQSITLTMHSTPTLSLLSTSFVDGPLRHSAVVSRMVDKEKGNEVEKEGTTTSTGTRICCHFAQCSGPQTNRNGSKNYWTTGIGKKTGKAFGLQDCAQYVT